jgi:hypothetical protein
MSKPRARVGLFSLARVAAAAAAAVACAPTHAPSQGAAATELAAGAGLTGNYGFLTDYRCQSEASARAKIDTLVDTFHISDVQLYDWFASYSQPTAGASWSDPWFRVRPICRQTIAWYIDELHVKHARAWAYVQAIAAEEETWTSEPAGIAPLRKADGSWLHLKNELRPPDGVPTYLPGDGWARHQVEVWGRAVAELRFDGIHWDTIGAVAGDYAAETRGIRAFLRTAGPLLAALGLKQTMNFVDVSWWDESLLADVAFPYMEVWPGGSSSHEQMLYDAMSTPAMQRRWGVMAFYPSSGMPAGWTQSQTMIARWRSAPAHHLRYLVVGDGRKRLVNEYFPSAVPLTDDEVTALTQK